MAGIFCHTRRIDLLQGLEEVDPDRIGVIGHSLGDYEPDTSRLWYRNFRMKRGELERLAENSAPLVEAAAKTAGLK